LINVSCKFLISGICICQCGQSKKLAYLSTSDQNWSYKTIIFRKFSYWLNDYSVHYRKQKHELNIFILQLTGDFFFRLILTFVWSRCFVYSWWLEIVDGKKSLFYFVSSSSSKSRSDLKKFTVLAFGFPMKPTNYHYKIVFFQIGCALKV
jgi:hypothetical protein